MQAHVLKLLQNRTFASQKLHHTVSLSMDNSDCTTKSFNIKNKPQPKLKLKLSDKAASQAPGTYFLGQYDRELDSDDEDLAFEEQSILRMPPGDGRDNIEKSYRVGDDASMMYSSSSKVRAWLYKLPLLTLLFCNFRLPSCCIPLYDGNSLYSARVVDLSCILESQKNPGQQANASVQGC